jgi:hypothetical protein
LSFLPFSPSFANYPFSQKLHFPFSLNFSRQKSKSFLVGRFFGSSVGLPLSQPPLFPFRQRAVHSFNQPTGEEGVKEEGG